LAGFVLAIAGDLNFFAPCSLAVVAAVFLVGWHGALTRLVGALTSFLVIHVAVSFPSCAALAAVEQFGFASALRA